MEIQNGGTSVVKENEDYSQRGSQTHKINNEQN